MEQSFSIKIDDLQPSLIEGLKKYFKAIDAKEITISYSSPKKKNLRDETNLEAKNRIEKAINNIEKGNNISFTGEEFIQLSKVLTSIR